MKNWFVYLAIVALAFSGNAIAAEKLPRALENINPAEIKPVTDEKAKEIRGGPCDPNKNQVVKIPQRSFYNPTLRQVITLPGFRAGERR